MRFCQSRFWDSSGTGNIRNVQLAVPFSQGADAVIGIDDDEIIEDPAFLSKVERWIGKKFNGDVIGGMAGPFSTGTETTAFQARRNSRRSKTSSTKRTTS